MLVNSLAIVLAYFAGAISTAIITCRLLGLPDPRQIGSGNPGATNVLRSGSRKAAAITLVGDMLKGFVPVLLAHWLGLPEWAIAGTGIAAFCGHVWPVYYGFKGGKGVATALGVLFGLHWLVGLAATATWLVVAAAFRYSSLAALTAALLAPVYVYWFIGDFAQALLVILMVVMIFWRHTGNIQRLWAGTEARIGGKSQVQ